MRAKGLYLLTISLLLSLAAAPARAEYPAERIFTVDHTPPIEAFSEMDLNLTVAVQSNCDDFDNFLANYNCAGVELSLYYETPVGVPISRTVHGNNGTDPQALSIVVPKEDIELGEFVYYMEVSQTYCVFFGCAQAQYRETFDRVRIPEAGEQDVPVTGAFPNAASDNVIGISINGATLKLNFQECGPRGGAGSCTTDDSRPTKYFSGGSRGALYYPCQGTAERLDGAAFAGGCVYDSEDNSQGIRDSTAKTQTQTTGNCSTWTLRTGALIGASMDAEFVQTTPGTSTQMTFLVSEFFLNASRSGDGVDVWTVRSQATDSGSPNSWSYFIGWDKQNAKRYVKMYLSGHIASSSPTAVCANGDHIADLVVDVAGVGLLYQTA